MLSRRNIYIQSYCQISKYLEMIPRLLPPGGAVCGVAGERPLSPLLLTPAPMFRPWSLRPASCPRISEQCPAHPPRSLADILLLETPVLSSSHPDANALYLGEYGESLLDTKLLLCPPGLKWGMELSPSVFPQVSKVSGQWTAVRRPVNIYKNFRGRGKIKNCKFTGQSWQSIIQNNSCIERYIWKWLYEYMGQMVL